MKVNFLQRHVLHILGIICLSVTLLASSCSIKFALTHSLNIDNYSGQSLKTTSQCSFTALEETTSIAVVAQRQNVFSFYTLFSQDGIAQHNSMTLDFPVSRSVPLYILYQQLRDSLVS